jgi:hypothetical protein
MNLTLRELFDRYGPGMALVVAIFLLAVLLPGNATRGSQTNLASGGTGSAGAGASTGADAANAAGGTGSTGGGGSASGGASGAGIRQAQASLAAPAGTSCRQDGRMPGFSLYMPPCLPVFQGANGGATSAGVTADKVVIVRYMAQIDPATTAVLGQVHADDGRAKNDDMDQTLVDYYNDHIETFGRKVVMETYDGSGDQGDEAVAKRDAIGLIAKFHPFAVFYTAPTAPTPAFTNEIAARKVICVCAQSQSEAYYQRNSPYAWGQLPTLEDYYRTLAEYIGKRLANHPAKWAGDTPGFNFKGTNRKFGLIYVDGIHQTVDPDAEAAEKFYERELAKYGVILTDHISYLYDISREQDQATNVIAKMHQEGVSNILCICDPLYPIFLTTEATRQQYYPEWLISGTGLIDSTFFGRLYDKQQWVHAFGVGPLWVFYKDVSTSSGAKAYHHMHPNAKPGEEGRAINVRQAAIQELFTGIQLAGPRLTPASFADGMFHRWPVTGGQPKFPLVYYTAQKPVQVHDFTEVFWNSTGTGKSEVNDDGTGIIMKADGGRRYQLGQWPTTEPHVFTSDGAVFTSDEPPESFPHDSDHHTHPATERCRSCR